MSLTQNSPKTVCTAILNLHESIRFVSRIQDDKVSAIVTRKNWESITPELNDMVHYQASKTVSKYEMSEDSVAGITDWMITCKENVKLITVFPDDGLLVLSVDPAADHDEILARIMSLNMEI